MQQRRYKGGKPLENPQKILPLLPLRGILAFPNSFFHFDVGRDKSIAAIETAMVQNQIIFLSAQKDPRLIIPNEEDIYDVGTIAKIRQMAKTSQDTLRVLIEGESRAVIKDFIQKEPFFKVKIQHIPENLQEITPEEEALMRKVLELFGDYIKITQKSQREEILISLENIINPGNFADIIASNLMIRLEEKQKLLESFFAKERLELLFEILTRELEILSIEKKINRRLKSQIEKTQREYYLRERIKAIQKELGDDETIAEAKEYRKKILDLNLDSEYEEKMLKQVDRLQKIPPLSAEITVIRNYLDWIVELPWNKLTKDRLDLKRAQKILNEDHYGLDKVKERILEFLAVSKLSKKLKGPILCFVGPPGVGKTSVAKSIAKAMGREFVRASLGGLRDEAEIRGHRRTYVGALPGRIVQGINKAGTKNPVFLLDEIDKINHDFRGDPASALLEVLDPEQNKNFQDHYIEIPFDLSKVLFIMTANSLHGIPRPLLDRMEVIEVSGYTEEEKLQIAKRHLIPKQIRAHGLENKDIVFLDEAILKIIRQYTREAGVRNLERQIASICRKMAKIIVEGGKVDDITSQLIEDFLGIPQYQPNALERKDLVGVATGLAWTQVGGDIINIEVTVMPGSGKLFLTGKLGDIMQESAKAGYSYTRSTARELGIDERFYEDCDIHIHIPQGAIPKDGPSAGITMTCALISALTKKPIDKDIAMTGEITLRGRILPVGGIKEKVLAAHRAGIKKVILPKKNQKDLEQIPENIKEEIEFILVDKMAQVLPRALKSTINLPTHPEKYTQNTTLNTLYPS